MKTVEQMREEKKVQMQVMTDSIQTMIRIMNPKKRWKIEYYRMSDNVKHTLMSYGMMTDWDVERFKLRNNEEYIMIWDSDYHMLYTIDVTAESALYAGQHLMELLVEKF
jgi:hypothetical protein